MGVGESGGEGGGGDDQRLIYNVQEREEKDFRRKKSLSKGQSFISGSNGSKISWSQDGEKLYSDKHFIPIFWLLTNLQHPYNTPPPPTPFKDQIWLVICLQTYLTILYVLHAYPVFHSSDAKPWWYCHFIIIIYTHITVRYKAIQQVSYKPVQTSHSQALPLSKPLALESFALSH